MSAINSRSEGYDSVIEEVEGIEDVTEDVRDRIFERDLGKRKFHSGLLAAVRASIPRSRVEYMTSVYRMSTGGTEGYAADLGKYIEVYESRWDALERNVLGKVDSLEEAAEVLESSTG